jgi:hypothetical protein
MKKHILYFIGAIMILISGCSKKTPGSGQSTTWDGNIISYSPVPVSKSLSKKVFAHMLPWFNYSVSSGVIFWGQHWTMVNENPDIISNNERQVASYFYPSIGPYASNDTNVIDYQLLLMKLSGIDGVFIDWPGTQNTNDYAENVANSNAIISRLSKVGLSFAIVYEDRNLPTNSTNAEISQAQTDMLYLQNNYFNNSSYEKLNGQPLLLDFGPVNLTNSADWTQVFSVLSPSNVPTFFTIMNQSSQAGSNATGEFAWVEQNSLSGGLSNFYGNGYAGTKVTCAFPGFQSFYAAGGWPSTGLTWVITPDISVFQQTLTMALQQTNDNYLQLVTWNDYGEGTMIEPTVQFGYSFLTALQQQLGVQSLSQSDLELVAKLFNARVQNGKSNALYSSAVYNPTNLDQLDQAFYDMASLKMDSASALLSGF